MGVKFGVEEGITSPYQISPPSLQHYHSSAFRMEIIIIGKFSLTISAILAAILDSEKATRVASATRAKFQAYTKNYWKMHRNDCY